MKKATHSCIICASAEEFDLISNLLRDSREYSIVRCKLCGHVQISPLPSPEDDKKFYDNNKQPKNIGLQMNLEDLRARYLSDTDRRAKFVSDRFPRGSSLLDIGSYYGFFLAEMLHRGYQAKGIEISKEPRDISKQVTDAPVFDINLLEESNADIGSFDIITMSHVLEHISSPMEFCCALRRYLKKDGRIIVEVPNLDDMMLKASPQYKAFWFQRAHISYFSLNSLKRIFLESGYNEVEITGVQRYGIFNMMNWLVTAKPQIKSRSLSTKGSYKWLEQYYKSHLEKTIRCDTLIATVGS